MENPAICVVSAKTNHIKYEIQKNGGTWPEFFVTIIFEYNKIFKSMWNVYVDKSGGIYQHIENDKYTKILYDVDDSIEIADESQNGNGAIILGKAIVEEIQKKCRTLKL